MKSSLAIVCVWICLNIVASTQNGCTEPPKVENAEVSPASSKVNYVNGDQVDYICIFGYVSLRKISYVCSRNKWISTRSGECAPKRCELPADIQNGRYTIESGNNFVVGSTIKYICNDGFQMMTRTDSRTCRLNGWDNQLPVCEETVCSADVSPARRINVEGLPDDEDLMRHGHRLTFSCAEEEMILRGHKEIICQLNGEWSHPFPICEEVTCLLNQTEDNIKVQRVPVSVGLIKPGDRLQFSCIEQGLILKGQKEITCQADGEWNSPFPKCEEARCVANITNMIIEGRPEPGVLYQPGERLKVSCVQGRGLTLQGQNEITCQEDGEWNSPFPTCVVKTTCGHPPNMNHQNADTVQILNLKKTEYESGEKVEYTCFGTFTIEGDPHLTCSQGKWTGNFTCIEPCLASVAIMDSRNIQLQRGGRERMFCPHRDHITFRCQRGKYQKRNSVDFRQQCLYGKMTLPECE